MNMSELSSQEVAKILGISIRTLRKYVVKGYLKPIIVKEGKRLRHLFSEDEVVKLKGEGFTGEQRSVNSPVKDELISYKILYEKGEQEKKDLHRLLEEARQFIGQLQGELNMYRPMLEERARSIIEKEAEKKQIIAQLEQERKEKEILQEMLSRVPKWIRFLLRLNRRG